ncbi:ATP-binding cassette domain-containing protein [Streptomyces nojiriensis]
MSSGELLRVTGLRKTYRTAGTEVVAVDDLSFSLRTGGALGIVGESGSGKTTTARMLIGLERPDAGEILVQGTPLAASVRGGRRGWRGPRPSRSSSRTPTSRWTPG